MRIICRQCGTPMHKSGMSPQTRKGAALEFECTCSSGVYLEVNDGEAMLVQSLGFKPQPAQAPSSAFPARTSNEYAETLIPWSSTAWIRMQRIPDMVRPMVMRTVAKFAESRGFTEITDSVLDQFKTSKGFLE